MSLKCFFIFELTVFKQDAVIAYEAVAAKDELKDDDAQDADAAVKEKGGIPIEKLNPELKKIIDIITIF